MAGAIILGEKERRPFLLFDVCGRQIGHGIYYPVGGNVQVYMDSSGRSAWQFHSISEVLTIPEVNGFRWK